MRYSKRVNIFLILILTFSVFGYGQLCPDFQKMGDCQKDFEATFRYYNQSRGEAIKIGSSAKYNIVFYGNKEYKLSFCTVKKFYPVHFKLTDVITEEVLYDNESDNYIESIGFGIEKTKQLLVEVEILEHKAGKKEIEENLPCLGMLIQFKAFDE